MQVRSVLCNPALYAQPCAYNARIEPGDVIAGRYRVDRFHASGGMGNVYRATELESERPIALKVVNVESATEIGRFEREVEALAKLSSPAIVRYIDHGVTDDGLRYLVQEWIEGVSLSRRLESTGLTIAEAVEVVRGTAAALIEAHALGIVHRDLKPSNLMLENSEVDSIRLLDFGIARLANAGNRLTRTGIAVGTPGFMSPEQAVGSADQGARADVFSLGCILYYCLTGMPPFPGLNATSVRTKLLLCEPPPLSSRCPEAPAELVDLVAEMLHKIPDRRPENAEQVVQKLDAIDVPEGSEVRRARVLDQPTVREPLARSSGKSAGGEFVSIVMIRDTDDDAAPITGPRLDSVRAAVDVYDGQVESIAEDSVVIRFRGTANEVAARAARAALVVAASYPMAGVAIGSGEIAATADVIEGGSKWLETACLERLFTPDTEPRIHIDALTAELLGEQFPIEPESQQHYVLKTPRTDGGTA